VLLGWQQAQQAIWRQTLTVPVMQDRGQKRTPQRRGGSLEQGEQGPDGRQSLPFIMRCQRLGELTELGAGDSTMTTDVLDQGGNSR
jgi:hypothetical protein